MGDKDTDDFSQIESYAKKYDSMSSKNASTSTSKKCKRWGIVASVVAIVVLLLVLLMKKRSSKMKKALTL